MRKWLAKMLRGRAAAFGRWANRLDPKSPRASQSELLCMVDHVGYEVAAAEAAGARSGSLMADAFLTHARSLSDFFQSRPGDKKSPTDVIAEEFLGKPWRATRENLNVQQLGAQDVRKAINIQVQHLSVHRCRRGAFEWPEWQRRAPGLFTDLHLMWDAFTDSMAKENPSYHAALMKSYHHWQEQLAK